MQITQSPLFKRTYKKLKGQELTATNSAIKAIVENPLLGTEKKQDLAGIRVYKYKVSSKQFLLAYSFDPIALKLIMLGVHENFYRDLKTYIN